MKLGYLLELVLAMAVGLALAHGWMEAEWVPRLKTLDLVIWLFSNPAYTFLSGVVAVEALGLWIEKARGRGPRPWGIGRIMWSTLGVVWLGAWGWVTIAAGVRWRLARPFLQTPFWTLVLQFTVRFVEVVAWVPPAVFLTTRLAGLPRDPKPDGREWAGRFFGFLIFLDYICFQIYLLYDNGALQSWWKR